MSNERGFVFLTAPGRRPPTWLRVWLTIAAVAAGAVLLWLGVILALAMLFAAVPVWAWRLFAANRRSGGPATIEGDYTISAPRRLRHLPIVENSKALAVVSSGDLTHCMVKDQVGEVQKLVDLAARS